MELEPLGLSNEVIELDMMGLGDTDAIDIEHPVDDDEDLVDVDNSPTASAANAVSAIGTHIPEGDTNLEPCQGMEFESEEAAKAFYNSYARRVGFSTRVSKARRSTVDGGIIQREDLHQGNEATTRPSDPQFGSQQSSSTDDDEDVTIEKLTRQLDRARRKCEVYRSNLLSILKDIEEQKLQLSVKVQNVKFGMKD
ncbi:hypothetical protein RJT34_06155 [Clitoria ternatea]|uniref:Protein FAR1-RELATED SEQUENCE n=1 Tax=Clitoria ternatea TaxID=43366 RepID=A0AAN9K3U7_CLITE